MPNRSERERARELNGLTTSELELDNGEFCQVVYCGRRDRIPYKSEGCEFTPIGWVKLEDD